MIRPAQPARRRRVALLLLGSLCASLAAFTYYLHAFPSELSVSASRFFASAPPPPDARIVDAQRVIYALGGARPICPRRAWHAARYAPLRNASTVFIALNLYNSAGVLPTFAQELPVLVDALGPERVFVSVYESNSADATPVLLARLAEVLAALGVPHGFVYGGADAAPPGSRIARLAGVRNAALAPLYSGAAAELVPGGRFDTLLFMNDVTFCAADMLELLYEKRVQGASQACAVDWMDAVVYDRWVLRDIHGSPFYRWQDLRWFYGLLPAPFMARLSPPLPGDAAAAARFAAHLPVQVFSCWNGAAAFDADVFAAPGGIRFRTSANSSKGGRDGEGKNAVAGDRASECFLTSVDMWKAGRGRVMLVPRASVSYDNKHYHVHRKDHLRPVDAPRIEWVEEPPAKVAMQDFAFWTGPERWAPWDEQ